jgi:hypothetical protein
VPSAARRAINLNANIQTRDMHLTGRRPIALLVIQLSPQHRTIVRRLGHSPKGSRWRSRRFAPPWEAARNSSILNSRFSEKRLVPGRVHQLGQRLFLG